jgi:hypothetical protein
MAVRMRGVQSAGHPSQRHCECALKARRQQGEHALALLTAQLVEMETRNDLLREARTTLATANPMWIEVMAVLSPESIACQVRAWHGVAMKWEREGEQHDRVPFRRQPLEDNIDSM